MGRHLALILLSVLVYSFGSGINAICASAEQCNPTLLGSYDTPGVTRNVYVSGSRAYVAERGWWNWGVFRIIDVSNPMSPILIGSSSTPNVTSVYVSGTTAYLTWGFMAIMGGLQIIDVSNPTAPMLLGDYNTSHTTYGVYVSGSRAYVVGGGGLEIIDISNPRAPSLLGIIGTQGWAFGIYVLGNMAYIVDAGSFRIIDVSNPRAPTLLGSISTMGWDRGIYVSRDRAYIVDPTNGLQIIDISNPRAPILLSRYNTKGYGVYVSGSIAYVAGVDGLQIIDVSDSRYPKLIGSYIAPSDPGNVYVSDDTAYVAGGWNGALHIIDVSSCSIPETCNDSVDNDGDGLLDCKDPDCCGDLTCIEKICTESSLVEILLTEKALLNNVQVTGDFAILPNFTNLEFVTVTTGPFAGKGFSKGEFETTLEGIPYKGRFKGLLFLKPQERKLYLKGAISGDISATVEGFLTESVQESNIYDQYQAVWKIGRIGNTTTSTSINLNGVLSYQNSSEFANTDLYVLQTNIERAVSGDYTELLSIVSTHIRVINQANPYYGEGFSIISYTSNSGSGEGWTYDKVVSPNRVELNGLFSDPLYGIVYGTLLTKTLSLTIERVDLGLPPAPELKVKVWGPQRVSPGQTINYIIEYRNDGLLTAPDVAVIMNLSPFVEYISASEGALYAEGVNEVGWNLGDLPPKTLNYLSVQARVIWGLPQNMSLSNHAFIESFTLHSEQIGEVRSGVSLPRYEYRVTICQAEICWDNWMTAEEFNVFKCPDFSLCNSKQLPQYKSWRSVSSRYDSSWQPILNTGDLFPIADALHAAFASPLFGDGDGNPIPTDFNKLDTVETIQDYTIEYSGGNAVGDGRLKLGKDTLLTTEGVSFTKYKVSSVLFDPDILLPLYKQTGVKKVVLYQSEWDDILEFNGAISYNKQTGWDMAFEGLKAPQFIDIAAAKLIGVVDAINLFEQRTGKQVEWLLVNTSKGPEGKYGKDRFSIKLSTKPEPIVFYLQGNPRAGELFKQEDFTNLEGIDVELRDRSSYKIPHDGWQPWLLKEDIFTQEIKQKQDTIFFGEMTNLILNARDPNQKLVSPVGDVMPAQRLIYKVEYENEGEGIAFGVYFTDTLNENLDDSTLEIGPVIDVQTGSQIAPAGTYNPQTRTITWFVGEVGPKQGGFAEFSVNVKNDTPDNAEIINFATVYFPSVPETTRTNGTVNRVTTFTDNIAPTTIASSLPLPNQAGWNNTDVTITLTVQDNEGGSGISRTEYSLDSINWTTYTSPFNITTEGTTTLYYKSTDNTGNTESAKTLTTKLDKTSPTITATTSPQPNSYGWNNSDVTITFTVQDTLSGIASVTQPITLTTEGANQYIGGEAVDFADNKATTYVIISLDKTPPDITLTLNPVKLSNDDEEEKDEDNEGNWYELSYFAQDSLSGLNSLRAGLVIPSLDGYQIESEQDKDLDIRIDEKKKELELEAPNPQELLTQLQSGLLTLNSGQILQLKLKQGDAKWKIKEKEKGIEIQSPSIIFKAFAVDYADNIATKEIEFTKEKHDED